jgi:NAD(P)H-nitrite reductase large subunit
VWIDIAGQGVELAPGRTAQMLDAEHKRVTDDQGSVYTFDKLLLATGGTPRRFPWGVTMSSTTAHSTIISDCGHWQSRASASQSSAVDSSARRSLRRWR